MADSFTTFKQHLPTQTTTYIPDKRLKRSVFNKKIAGVCGGIAEYFGIDSTLVRIAFVLGTFVFGGVFIPLYVVLALVLPKR
ncbi:MAG: PspC domain-containing protein [Cytophagales bacterium]|nr:MAG: PspC domain-containing protein [Cytophagales bacterium]